ncbi:hypothetical protein C8Q73DRAFT_538152 [Cubamyces lactineus]|nr:hypothetical protein C8Q73DRAFT_538152 [Cubamyces lactineus]
MHIVFPLSLSPRLHTSYFALRSPQALSMISTPSATCLDCLSSSATAAAAATSQAQKMNLSAVLAGCVVQNIFYGNCFFLVWRYLCRDRKADAGWFVASIILAWLLCTFSVIITVHGLWFFMSESIWRENASTPWTVDFFLLVNSLVACLVRMLYVQRLWKLSRSLTLFVLPGRIISAIALVAAICLCIVDLAGSIEISVRLYTTPDADKGNVGAMLRPVFILIFATGICADAILTAMMCLWLNNARTGLKRTDSIINTLIVYSIETGLFPGLIETAGMIAFFANPGSQIFLAFYLQIGILYLSSLLTSLTARRKVQQRIDQPFSVNFSALNRVCDTTSQIGTDGGARASSDLSRAPSLSVRHLAIPRPSHLVMRAHTDDILVGDNKAMTPDVERPQEQIQREMLARTHPAVVYEK